MLKYFLKYWVGGALLIWFFAYLLVTIINFLPKIIILIFMMGLLICLVRLLYKWFGEEYRHYIEYEKPHDEAMKKFRGQVWQHMKTDFRVAWTDYRKSRQS